MPTHQDILDRHLAHHAGWNECHHILHELDAEVGSLNRTASKSIRSTVCAKRRLPIRRSRNKGYGVQPSWVCGFYRSHLFGGDRR